jgi:hypothetical protein
VEGFEHEALKGASRILACAPRLDLELHIGSYEDKAKELRQVLDMILLERYSLYIQVEVDGPMVPFQKEIHTWDALANAEVIHLFCH